MDYTNRELQAVMIARQIKNSQTVVVGTGLPLIGASLAKKTYAPKCHLVVESGLMDCRPKEVPSSVADLRFMANAAYFGSNLDILDFSLIYPGIKILI